MTEIGALAKALAAAQGEMRHAGKDRTNPHFKNEYATLASVIDACKPALNKHGIAIVQLVCGESADYATVETMLLHESGQAISAKYSMPVSKKDAQGHGSAITYARRYSLLAIVGLAADDDDGNDASRAPAPRNEPARNAAPVHQSQPKDNGFAITSGPAKGKLFTEASDAELNAYFTDVASVLGDKSKSAHHAKAQAIINALESEIDARSRR